jgi:hypothetical protein
VACNFVKLCNTHPCGLVLLQGAKETREYRIAFKQNGEALLLQQH